MRAKEREVTNLDQIFEIVRRCSVVHVAMIDHGKPYVVALNFGYERRGDMLVLYFHSAYEGRKMDALKENPSVFFEMDCAGELVRGSRENPCAYSWRYESVTGSGQVEFVEDPEEKAKALGCLIRHLGNEEGTFEFPQAALKKTCVYRICSTDFTGKHHE